MEKHGDPFQQAGAHTSYKWSYPSLPVIPPEVNGVWIGWYVFGVQSYLLTFGVWKPRVIIIPIHGLI